MAVVAGFQGIDTDGNITTLGRGGSDTTAVAIAAAIKADVCEIYTDVDGVYTTDPNICPSAQKIDRISYEEMLELASLGAKVLQIRSVEVAMKYGVPVHVRSSFSDRPGTMVVGEEGLEAVVVAGLAYDKQEAKVQLVGVSDRPGVVALGGGIGLAVGATVRVGDELEFAVRRRAFERQSGESSEPQPFVAGLADERQLLLASHSKLATV